MIRLFVLPRRGLRMPPKRRWSGAARYFSTRATGSGKVMLLNQKSVNVSVPACGRL